MKLIILLSVFNLAVYANPFGQHLADPVPFNGTKWVFLAAGGMGWDNYRHQGNVYHAYQIVKSHGIPDKNIIVMHTDDLAYSKYNPTPGVVVNRINGSDVYHGVPKDYTGAEVTPLNFLAALKGDPVLARSGKKVVNSGPNDHIFVYFIDHGSDDLIAFPHSYLYGEELNSALKEMYNKKRYAKMVLNIEACHSGSMFEKLLPKDINIYVTTSANPHEDSYVCDYDKLRKTYLGDYYSGNWLVNIETKDLAKETLGEMYQWIKARVNASHPSQYGDLNIANLPVGDFIGAKPSLSLLNVPIDQSSCNLEKSYNIPILIAQKRIEHAKNNEEKIKYVNELERKLKGRQLMDKHFEGYVNSVADMLLIDSNAILNERRELNNRQCYRQLVDTFHDKCFNLNQNAYAFSKLKIFVNICEQIGGQSDVVDHAVNTLIVYCEQYKQSENVYNID